MAKTHCKNGHERTPENVNSSNQCKPCRRDYDVEYRRTHGRKTYPKGSKAQLMPEGRINPERKRLLDNAVADGWPIRQIIATYGIGTSTIKNYYPDYHGMSAVEAGKLSQLMQRSARTKPVLKYAA